MYDLCIIISPSTSNRSFLEIAQGAINGGATLLQLREKGNSAREVVEMGKRLRELTRAAGIPFIINDRVDIAVAVEADGVHLGQDDLPLKVARRILGERAIIGASAGNVEEALRAQEGGADYLGVGSIFPTPSKSDAGEPIGCSGLREIKAQIDLPIIAVGGITLESVEEVLEAGASGIAVISAVAKSSDVTKATAELALKIKEFKGRQDHVYAS